MTEKLTIAVTMQFLQMEGRVQNGLATASRSHTSTLFCRVSGVLCSLPILAKRRRASFSPEENRFRDFKNYLENLTCDPWLLMHHRDDASKHPIVGRHQLVCGCQTLRKAVSGASYQAALRNEGIWTRPGQTPSDAFCWTTLAPLLRLPRAREVTYVFFF